MCDMRWLFVTLMLGGGPAPAFFCGSPSCCSRRGRVEWLGSRRVRVEWFAAQPYTATIPTRKYVPVSHCVPHHCAQYSYTLVFVPLAYHVLVLELQLLYCRRVNKCSLSLKLTLIFVHDIFILVLVNAPNAKKMHSVYFCTKTPYHTPADPESNKLGKQKTKNNETSLHSRSIFQERLHALSFTVSCLPRTWKMVGSTTAVVLGGPRG